MEVQKGESIPEENWQPKQEKAKHISFSTNIGSFKVDEDDNNFVRRASVSLRRASSILARKRRSGTGTS
jgi:hypothetical protein